MPSVLPPALTGHHALDLFFTFAQLLQEAGVDIKIGHVDDGDADWDAATHTLILRAGADHDDHTWSLGEFYRRIKLGPAFSQFVDKHPVRHLYAVT